jgi:hypothetical protein
MTQRMTQTTQQDPNLREGSIDRNLLDWQQVGPILLEAIEDIDWALSSQKPEEAQKIVEHTWKRLKSMERKADA